MGLTGTGTVVVAAVVAVALVVTTALTWNRWHRLWRWPARIGLLVLGDVAAVLVVALVLNGAYAFYPSWSDLFGGPSSNTTQAVAGSQDAALAGQLAAAARSGHGLIVPLDIAGTASHVVTHSPALVYLPAVYGDPAWARVRFPVVELLPGFPGSPQTWTGILHVQGVLDKEIAAHEMTPTIAVMPVQNVAGSRDTECANVVGGPQVDTYLTEDVRTAVTTAFRASTTGRQWALAGYSTGGYCAGVMAARHSTMFGAAASIEGYDTAAHDRTTGDLFGHDSLLAAQAGLEWWMHHRPSSAPPLLVIATRQDPQSLHDALHLDAWATAGRWPVSQAILPRGGHNATTFDAELPMALSWVSHQCGGALAPVPGVDGVLPQPVTTSSTHHPGVGQ